MTSERMTLALEPGTRDLLLELAGGERKVGAYISRLVREVAAGRFLTQSQTDRAALYLGSLEARLVRAEQALETSAARVETLEATLLAAHGETQRTVDVPRAAQRLE